MSLASSAHRSAEATAFTEWEGSSTLRLKDEPTERRLALAVWPSAVVWGDSCGMTASDVASARTRPDDEVAIVGDRGSVPDRVWVSLGLSGALLAVTGVDLIRARAAEEEGVEPLIQSLMAVRARLRMR
jgi:hypothetical protein